MKSTRTSANRIELGPLLVGGIGLGLLLLGGRGYSLRGQIGLADALQCGLLLIPAAFLLLVTSYVIQLAKLVSVIPILLAGLLVHAYPSFAVALGLAVIGQLAAAK